MPQPLSGKPEERRASVGGNYEIDKSAKLVEVVNTNIFRGEDDKSRERWGWLLSQVKLMVMLKKGTGMTNMRLPQNQSVSSRIARLEERLDEYPSPKAIYDTMDEIPPIKERLNSLEEELPKMQEQLDGLMYLKDEVKLHGEQIIDSQKKIQENLDKINILDAYTQEQSKRIDKHDKSLREMKDSFEELKEDLDVKMQELKDDLEEQIEEKLNFQKQLEEEQLLAFVESVEKLRTMRNGLSHAVDNTTMAEDTKARLEDVVAHSSQLLKDCGARNKEEQPPRDLCERLQSLVSDMHRVLVEDTERTEEGKKAEWTPLEELAAPSDGSVDDPLLFLMKQAMDSLADSLHPHLRVLRTQLPLEEAIERNAKSAQAKISVVAEKVESKAEHDWVEEELEKKSTKPPVEALRLKLEALEKSVVQKQKEYAIKLGKSINETVQRFNRLQEMVGTKAAKEQMAKELSELDDKIIRLTGDNLEKAREFILNSVRDKVTRKELEDALKAFGEEDEGSSADMDVVASFMPFRCLACNKPLKKVQEVKKFSKQTDFFPPSTNYAPNSLHILRPQSNPSIPSKRRQGPIHTRVAETRSQNDLLTRSISSTTALPPPRVRGRSSMRQDPSQSMAPETQVFASYPGFLPSNDSSMSKKGGGFVNKQKEMY